MTHLEGDAAPRLSEQLLETLYRLVGNTDPVNFSNFISNVKSRLQGDQELMANSGGRLG